MVLAVAAFDLARILRALVAGQRAEHEINAAANQLGRKIGMSKRGEFRDEFLHHLKPKLGVLHLAPAKTQRNFDLHVLAQKVNRMAHLDAEVVGINSRTELDFLDR